MAATGVSLAPPARFRLGGFDLKWPILIASALFAAYLALIPLVALVAESLKTGEAVIGIGNYVRAYTDPRAFALLYNSFVYAAGSAAFGFAIAFLLAWMLERTNLPGRRLLYAAALVPLIMPGVVTTIAWILLLSPKVGLLNLAAVNLLHLPGPPFDIYSLAGMIWVDGLNSSPLLFLLMAAALRSMNPAFEEAALTAGAAWPRVLWRVTLPLLVPAGAAALLLAFVRAIESFEVPALVGIPVGLYVFSARIYQAVHVTPPDYGLGSAHAMVLLLVMLAYYQLTRRGAQFQTVSGKGFRPRLIDLGRWRWLGLAVAIIYMLLLVGLPLAVIAYSSLLPFYSFPTPELMAKAGFGNFSYILNFEPFRRAFGHSVVLAL